MDNEFVFNARIRELERQRNNALTEVVMLAGDKAVLESLLDEAKKEIQELKTTLKAKGGK